jgi:hypothetical protein
MKPSILILSLFALLFFGCSEKNEPPKNNPTAPKLDDAVKPALNFSPLTAIAVGPAGPPAKFSVRPHCCPSTAIVATATTPIANSDLQSLLIGLVVPSGTKVKAVVVCYQVVGGNSTYISQVRLSEMSKPNQTIVRHDESTKLASAEPACYTSTVTGFTVNGTITLALSIVIGDPSDKILIGGISLLSE